MRILVIFGANFLLLHVISEHFAYVVILIGLLIDVRFGVAQQNVLQPLSIRANLRQIVNL